MKTENILAIEESGKNSINLVRDRLFWQAWNKSAFLFVSHIKSYHVHKRFVQKVSQEVAWLGFPSSALPMIQKTAADKGFGFEQKSPDHIIISGVSQPSGYEEWWAGIVKKKTKPPESALPVKNSKSNNAILSAYKTAFDLCLHIHRATLKMSREFRYELGARVRNYATDIAEGLHLAANNVMATPRGCQIQDTITSCACAVHKLRIDIRILKDLHQIGIEQWGFLNSQIETLLNLLRAEFCNANIRIAGATHSQSSGTLSTEQSASKWNSQ